jgi:phage gp46-like protein
MERWAETFARDALQPIIDQGAAVRVDVTVSADRPRNRLNLGVRLFGRDGSRLYDRKFDVVWSQVR